MVITILLFFMYQDSVNDLSEITVSQKAERMSELSQFVTGNKSSSSLRNSSELDVTSNSAVAASSTDTFTGAARTTAMEMTGMHGLPNGQAAGEQVSVGSLWPDMAAMQLGSSDMTVYPGSGMPVYAPIMVNDACLLLV